MPCVTTLRWSENDFSGLDVSMPLGMDAAMTAGYFSALNLMRLGLAPSSPRRFFLSASYS